MALRDDDMPTVGDLYQAGLLASALSFVGILLVISLSFALDGGGLYGTAGTLFLGTIYMIIPATAIAFLVTAPLGCIIGSVLLRILPPTSWLGGITGALVAIAAVILLALGLMGNSGLYFDPEIVLFVTAIIAIGSASGWYAHRRVLDWPVPPDESVVFE